MRPRLILAFGAVLLLSTLAGCSFGVGSISMTPMENNTALVGEASRTVPPPDDPHGRHHIVVDAIENGTATTAALETPVAEGRPFIYEGRYYDLVYEESGNTTGYLVTVEINDATTASDDTIAYDDLPQIDKRALEPLLADAREKQNEGRDTSRDMTYTTQEYESSALVEQRYEGVVYQGETYSLRVHDPEEVTLTTYRYNGILVAENDTAYAKHLRDQYAFELSGLSDNETEVIELAVNDTFDASSGDEGFDRLVDRFLAHEAVEHDRRNRSGAWLARYDGRLYWVELEYSKSVVDDG